MLLYSGFRMHSCCISRGLVNALLMIHDFMSDLLHLLRQELWCLYVLFQESHSNTADGPDIPFNHTIRPLVDC
jgi:hypothetical protein